MNAVKTVPRRCTYGYMMRGRGDVVWEGHDRHDKHDIR